MKRKQIFRSLLAASLIAISSVLSSCSSDGSKQQGDAEHADHTEATEQATAKSEVGNPVFEDEKVKAVYEHYIHLKNALVKADVKEAQAGAAQLQTALSGAGNTQGADMAGKIASSADIKVQREEFSPLTSEVEKVIKASKLTSGKIFKQFCPMAKDGDGGYWLAGESAVRNPYYGDEMLECGEVKEEIK